MNRHTPLDLIADAWRLIRNPLFWKVVTVASAVATTATTAGTRGYQWVVMQRTELKRASDMVAAKVKHEVEERKDEQAKLAFRQSLYEAQLRLLGAEHVRFVAAYRHQEVERTVKLYSSLVEHWPACPPWGNCMSPDKAIAVALAARF